MFSCQVLFTLQADHKHLSGLASKMFQTDGKVSTAAAKNLKFLLEVEESRVKNSEGLALEGNISGNIFLLCIHNHHHKPFK